MATGLLLPGFGGAVDQVLANVGVGTTYSDPLDLSRCGQFAVQVTVWASGALTLQAQQSLDGTHWANLGDLQTVAVGDVVRFDVTDGPFAFGRYGLTSADTTASATLRTAGYPVQYSN